MANEVTVEPRSDEAFDVEVHQGRTVTRHVVTVPAGLATQLGKPDLDEAELVLLSFTFLLEHEPANSILGHFDLAVIEQYFPTFLTEMTRRLKSLT